MKKVLLILVLICILLLLVLGYQANRYELSQSYENVQQVEIVYIANNGVVAKGSYDSIELVCAIEEQEWEHFFDALYSIKSRKYLNDPIQSLNGNVIRITYKDGAFELISKYSIFYCDSDKNGKYLWYYFDSTAISQLIQNYST